MGNLFTRTEEYGKIVESDYQEKLADKKNNVYDKLVESPLLADYNPSGGQKYTIYINSEIL